MGYREIGLMAGFNRLSQWNLGRVERLYRKRWLWRVVMGWKGVGERGREGREGRGRGVGRREEGRMRGVWEVMREGVERGRRYRFLAERVGGVGRRVVRGWGERLWGVLREGVVAGRKRAVGDSLVGLENLMRK